MWCWIDHHVPVTTKTGRAMPQDFAAIKAEDARAAGPPSLDAGEAPCFAIPMTDLDSNPTLALLTRRRSAPPVTMAGPGPTRDEMDKILALAARVPDHGKLAPWRFIVFEGEARARAGDLIAGIYAEDQPDSKPERIETERRRLQHAPTVVAIVSRAAPHTKIPEWEQLLSAGASSMNLIVAANALGFVTAWLTEWYSYDARVASGLGLAPHEKLAGFVHVGRPTAVVEDRVRPVMPDIVTYF
ncbi:MAG: nitroreductase family protein [Janthinobacterium lividum]